MNKTMIMRLKVTDYKKDDVLSKRKKLDTLETLDNEYHYTMNLDGFYRTDVLNEMVKTLSEREEAVISMRFVHEMTLDEVGAELCVSRERVRQIEARSLRKLRHPKVSNKMRDLLGLRAF
jgi:RNA polymerase sigma factor (sigma-70 family)